MQQAILGIDNQKLIFHQIKLAYKIFLVKLLPRFYIKLRKIIHPCFSILTQNFRISLKARPDILLKQY
jgi:hypothetical protein